MLKIILYRSQYDPEKTLISSKTFCVAHAVLVEFTEEEKLFRLSGR